MNKNSQHIDKYTFINRLLIVVVSVGGVLLMGMTVLRYNKKAPSDHLGKSKTIKLDKKLTEISGLSFSDAQGLLAINDEKGKIYSLDSSNGNILDEFSFSDPNDFEGIAAVGKHIYVVDSSGDLHRYNTESGKTKKIKTDLKHKNDIEGLCYNSSDSTLLIAAKGQSLPDKNKKSFSSIFKYDIKKGKLDKEVFLKIKMEEVEKALGKKIKDGFGTSGITIHNGQFIIVSHHSKAMLVYDQNMVLKSAYNLSSKIYNQPEGITFINDVLVISNEKGSAKKSTLVYHKNFSL